MDLWQVDTTWSGDLVYLSEVAVGVDDVRHLFSFAYFNNEDDFCLKLFLVGL